MRQNTSERSARRRRFLALAVAAAGAGLAARSAVAAVVAYDSDANAANGATDGTGLWNTTTANWYNASTATDVFFPGTYADTAVFGAGGTAGTVTVGTVSTGNIAFNAVTGSYTLTGGTITLLNSSSGAATTPTITLASGVSATISSTLAGGANSVNVNGSTGSILTFAGSNTYSGNTNINGATLNYSSGSAYSTATGTLDINGTVAGSPSTANIYSANAINFGFINCGTGGTGTGNLNVSAGSVTITGSDLIARTAGGFGNVLVTGTGTLTQTGSDTIVGQNGTATLTVNGYGSYLAAGATSGMIVGNGTASKGVLNLADNGTVTTYSTIVGQTGNAVGTINQSGGSYTQNTTQSFVVGGSTSADINATGNLNLSGGTMAIGNASGGSLYLGYYGKGVLNLSSTAALTTSVTYIGEYNVATGTVNQTGGTWTQATASDFRIGGGGSAADNKSVGLYNISAGTLSVGNASGGNFYVGMYGTGGLNLSGTGTVNAAKFFVGDIVGGSGFVNQSGGTLNVTTINAVRIGSGTTGVGVYTMSAGTINAPSDFQLAYGSEGAFLQTGGTVNVSSGYPSAARAAGGFGVFDIAGGAFNQGNPSTNFNVGEQGIGVLNVRGTGVVNAAGNIDIGASTNAAYNGSGTVNLLTGGLLNANAVIKGSSLLTGAAVFDFNGGTLATIATSGATFMGGLDAAYVYAGGAVIDTTAASATIAQPLLVPTGNGVSIATSGGTGFRAAPIVQITGGGGVNATAVATIDGSGNLTGITVTNPGTGYTSAPTVTLYNAGGGSGYSVTPSLTANATTGGLTKLGTNTLTLTGTSTYAGATTVSAGTLRVNGALLAAGSVSVQSGATLGGNGSVGAVTVAGTIAAGPDAVTVGNLSTGAQAWTTGGTFLDKFAGDNSANDVLVMTGLTNSASSFTVNLSGANASSASGTFVLAVDTGAMTADPFVTSSLTLTVNGSAAPAGYSLAEQPDTTGQGGVDLVLAATPEPTSLALVTAIAAPLLATRRRRRAVPATVVA